MKRKKILRISSALERLAELFSAEFRRIGDAVILNDMADPGVTADISSYLNQFKQDLTGIESFNNHFHLEDIADITFTGDELVRTKLMEVGRALIKVWAERLHIMLKGQAILFYLGGVDSVIVRFHLERTHEATWIHLSDTAFIQKERIEVYRGLDGKVIRLH